ncbi:MAG TPA: glycoside hydrolase family 3 C-terminal domain-containing protein, partial [Gemmatimonadaceae bacterium]
DGGVLPLRKDLGTIAVIGPNADEPDVLLGNYNGAPSDTITPLRGIREAVPGTHVIYALGSELAEGLPVAQIAPPSLFTTPAGRPGLQADYFDNDSLGGVPLHTGTDSTVNARWSGSTPGSDANPGGFGVRWSGYVTVPATGRYRLRLRGTMRFELWLDDSLVVSADSAEADGRPGRPIAVESVPLALDAGRRYRLRIDASATNGSAQLALTWVPPAELLRAAAVQAAEDADAVVLVLGITPRMEGEEMPLHIDGFDGGDRTKLALPDPQEQLMRAVVAVGKPTVLVLLNGSPLGVNWASRHVPAILEAWYPGQAGGTAIAETLFGDNDPGGRLPVTFYHSARDLPPFDSYDMAGRTYRFFNGTPLYPFGYGLSYTTFTYANLRTTADSVGAGDTVAVSVDVTNTGQRAGDEVVQLYVRYPESAVTRPNEDLRGFARVTLPPGQTRTVRLRVPVSSLAYWQPSRQRWTVESTPVQIAVGSSSADIRLTTMVRVTGGR